MGSRGVGLRSSELYTITNFLGKYTKTIGKLIVRLQTKITLLVENALRNRTHVPTLLKRLAPPTYTTGKQSEPVYTGYSSAHLRGLA